MNQNDNAPQDADMPQWITNAVRDIQYFWPRFTAEIIARHAPVARAPVDGDAGEVVAWLDGACYSSQEVGKRLGYVDDEDMAHADKYQTMLTRAARLIEAQAAKIARLNDQIRRYMLI